MAEASRFWTSGTGDGPSGGYTMTEFYDFVRRLITTDMEASQGVLRGVANELAVSGTSSPLSVAIGAAMVYGLFYENTAALNLTVATPITGTTGGRVNLKADWTAQTVRAVVQMNTDGTAAIPALTQTAGSEWNIPLATFTINTAGVITLTDARVFCEFATYFGATLIDGLAGLSVVGNPTAASGNSQAITAANDGEVLRRSGSALGFGQIGAAALPDNLISDAKLRQSAGLSVIGRSADSTGDPADITAGSDNTVLRRSGTTLSFGQVLAGMIASGAVTADKIAADSVDDTKLGNRVPQFYRRQGGSPTNWNTAGVSDYAPGAVRMQIGAISVSLGSGTTTATVTVTFPAAFSAVPIVLATMDLEAGMDPEATNYTLMVSSISATQVVLRVTRNVTTDGAVVPVLYWLAVGPE